MQLVLEHHSDRAILAEVHNSSIQLLWERYGDTLIYQSLNMFLEGNRTGAEFYFNKADHMWDEKGINGLATQEEGRYANYKLALILYASKVLNITIGNYSQIEEKMWSMQQENGGITSLTDLNGNPVGTANTETTSIALLPYNDELISRMQQIHNNLKGEKRGEGCFYHLMGVTVKISAPCAFLMLQSNLLPALRLNFFTMNSGMFVLSI